MFETYNFFCTLRQNSCNNLYMYNTTYKNTQQNHFINAKNKQSVETHCPGGFSEECPSGQACYGGLSCNVKDILEAIEEASGGSADSETSEVANKIDKHSPKRHNFCGTSWGDANGKCSIW